jgi:hypothetical protein
VQPSNMTATSFGMLLVCRPAAGVPLYPSLRPSSPLVSLTSLASSVG